MDLLLNPIVGALLTITILVFSAIFHEIAHGYVADRFGDPTARLMGRLTLDPRKHIDLFLSIILPLLLFLSNTGIIFGGAKPVPVDPFNLRDGRKDIALVSLAGPMTNILLAVLGTLIIKLLFPETSLFLIQHSSFIGFILGTTVQINLLLAIFNLLPIPPLDGSKIFAMILPERIANAYLSLSSVGTLLLLILLLFPIGGFSLLGVVATLFGYSLKLLGL
jgi:Zn-dependent protease